MEEAGVVVAVVAVEWAVGLVAAAAWTQSWGSIRRGHFRILAWAAVGAAVVGMTAARSSGADALVWPSLVPAIGAVAFLLAQYLAADSDRLAVMTGVVAAIAGTAALMAFAGPVGGAPVYEMILPLLAGTALLGGVTNGMLLGHWYLNQPGLDPAALARLTNLSLVASVGAAVAGIALAGRLVDASTEGAVLGLPGFGSSFGPAFFGIWVALIGLTGAVVWMARRCISIRSIQSATGLYYVALLTAGVAQFLVSYLIVRSA